MFRAKNIVCMFVLGIAVLSVCVPVAHSVDTGKKEATNTATSFNEKLRGKWVKQSREVDGKVLDDVDGGYLVVTEDCMMKSYVPGGSFFGFGSTLVRNVYFRIDETNDPVAIDQTGRSNWTEVTEGVGICRLEDDVLTLCVAAKNQPRPTAFSTDPLAGGGHVIIVYKRAVVGRK